MKRENQSVILVGCGNMGRAMLEGWISSGVLSASNAYIVEPADALRQKAQALNVQVFRKADELPLELTPELVIFAVKPQVMFDITPDYQQFIAAGASVLSVAAGIKTQNFVEQLGDKTAVIRVMPNTPAAVSKGMMVIFNNESVPAHHADFAAALLVASGAVATINDEALMDAVTAVSGSGPAYIFHMIEALRDAAIAAGLAEDIAKLLAEQTIYGAACYAKDSDMEPGVLREQVTSPNGTTAAALAVLMHDDALKNLMRDTVMAAKKRSEELGN